MEIPFKGWDRGFNVMVLRMAELVAPSFQRGPDAPETLEALTSYVEKHGNIKVSDQNMAQNVFGCDEANLAFRAWHDWTHWRYQTPFTPEGEKATYEHQLTDMMKVYGTLANKGVRPDPVVVLKVTDRNGKAGAVFSLFAGIEGVDFITSTSRAEGSQVTVVFNLDRDPDDAASDVHRMLYGGRVSYSTATPARLAESMRQRMAATLPALAGVPVDHAWGGFVDITMNRAPDFGRLPQSPQVYYLQGFSGHGLALTGLAGQLVAQAMAGDAARFDTFARLRHRAFPGGPWLRRPALVLGMAWYRMKDAIT